jgi:hypothetical protein
MLRSNVLQWMEAIPGLLHKTGIALKDLLWRWRDWTTPSIAVE